jgi:hypothetical protein
MGRWNVPDESLRAMRHVCSERAQDLRLTPDGGDDCPRADAGCIAGHALKDQVIQGFHSEAERTPVVMFRPAS